MSIKLEEIQPIETFNPLIEYQNKILSEYSDENEKNTNNSNGKKIPSLILLSSFSTIGIIGSIFGIIYSKGIVIGVPIIILIFFIAFKISFIDELFELVIQNLSNNIDLNNFIKNCKNKYSKNIKIDMKVLGKHVDLDEWCHICTENYSYSVSNFKTNY